MAWTPKTARPLDDAPAAWMPKTARPLDEAPTPLPPKPRPAAPSLLETVGETGFLYGVLPAAGHARALSALYDAFTGKQSEQTESLSDMARGARRGAAFDFNDEIAGAIGAGRSDRTYAQARDAERTANFVAEQRSPVASAVGMIAGSGAMPGGIPAKGAGMLKAAGLVAGRGLAEGAAYGLGASEAEDLPGIARDTGKGAAWALPGAVLGAGGAALGAKGSAVTGKMDEALGGIEKRGLELGMRDTIEATRSSKSELGNASRARHQSVREMEEMIRLGRTSPEQAAAYRAKLSEPLQQEFDRIQASNYLDEIDESPEKILNARALLDELTENKDKYAADAADKYLNHPWERTLRPWVERYGPGFIPPLAGAIGGAAGGALGLGLTDSQLGVGGGVVAGGIVGALGGKRAMRRPVPTVATSAGREIAEGLGDVASIQEIARAKASSRYRDAFGKAGGVDSEGLSPLAAVTGAAKGLAAGAAEDVAGTAGRPMLRAWQRIGDKPDIQKALLSFARPRVDEASGLATAAGAAGGFASTSSADRAERRAAFDRMKQTLGTDPSALGNYGKILLKAAAEGPEALSALHHVLSQREDYRALLQSRPAP